MAGKRSRIPPRIVLRVFSARILSAVTYCGSTAVSSLPGASRQTFVPRKWWHWLELWNWTREEVTWGTRGIGLCLDVSTNCFGAHDEDTKQDEHGASNGRAHVPLTEIALSLFDLGACIQQADYQMRGEQGMFEAVGFPLFNLAGMEASHAHWVVTKQIGLGFSAGSYSALPPAEGRRGVEKLRHAVTHPASHRRPSSAVPTKAPRNPNAVAHHTVSGGASTAPNADPPFAKPTARPHRSGGIHSTAPLAPTR